MKNIPIPCRQAKNEENPVKVIIVSLKLETL